MNKDIDHSDPKQPRDVARDPDATNRATVTGTTATTRAAPVADEEASIPGLLRDLTEESAHLAKQQVNLFQAEMKQSVNDVKLAIGAMVGAAVVGIAALGTILMGLGHLLDEALDVLGLGVLIVGAIAAAIAYFMYLGGKKKMEASELEPTRSERTLERGYDKAAAKTETR